MNCPHFGIPDCDKNLQAVIWEKMVALAYEQFQKSLNVVSMLTGKNLKVTDEEGNLFAAVHRNIKK
ncbi:hypothetical protein [Candidatus Oleimmundimicrobium sp.]|uniref:hypothetical protein n=1 Tax=Candidatus Oleimmundimicrobium sp. TaxID=3060597 RepID=UPI00272312DC|nr:hypothetical protein [Candidatus Oleimmundimicrobium sp.]MDO8885762.1 hypothetical protein [Candidatus Oleimmundimicrobium sp.]